MARRAVPHTSEDFWDGSFWYEVGESATHYWVGSTPRLNRPDGDGGYARIEPNDGPTDPGIGTTVIAARLAPTNITTAQPMRINAQVRFTGSWPSGQYLMLNVSHPEETGFGGTWQWGEFYGPPGPSDWITVGVDLEWPLAAPWLIEEFQQWARDGSLIVGANGGVTGETDYFDLSWIELLVSGYQPLRWRQRDDGLGVSGVKAARNVTSYQLGLGHRGYI